MNKGDFISFVAVLAIGLAMVGSQSINGGGHNSTTATVQFAAANLPAVPAEGTYTIGQLHDLINTSNPAGTSDFLLATDVNNVAIKSANMGDCSKVAGSTSVVKAGVVKAGWASDPVADAAVRATQVALVRDAAMLAQLTSSNRVLVADAHNYGQLLAYFEYSGYRFYLNDPFPVNRVGAPAIINKWDPKSFK